MIQPRSGPPRGLLPRLLFAVVAATLLAVGCDNRPIAGGIGLGGGGGSTGLGGAVTGSTTTGDAGPADAGPGDASADGG